MYLCVYVCSVYLYTYVCIWMYIKLRCRVQTCGSLHTRIYAHERTHTHIDTHKHIRAHTHTHAHACARSLCIFHTHARTHVRTHTHTHTYAHTLTRTHIFSLPGNISHLCHIFLSLTVTRPNPVLARSLSLSFCLSLTFSLAQTLTRTHTLSDFLSCTLSLSPTHSISLIPSHPLSRTSLLFSSLTPPISNAPLSHDPLLS